jgi:hypothetical protein
MATTPIGQAGLQGLRNSLELAQDAANRIVQATAEGGGSVADVAEAVVDLKAAELAATASARVLETANRTAGTLIDILV